MQVMRTLTISVLLLCACSLFAGAVAVQPPAPTSATPVTLQVQEFVTCAPPPTIVRRGNRFDIGIDPGPCLSPPVLATFTFEVGTLEPGDYEVVVMVNPPERTGYASFVVSDASTGVFVQSPAIGPTTGGTEVVLFADAVHCYSSDTTRCPLPEVTFNGVPATVNAERFAAGSLVVMTPPNAKGIAEVIVSGPRATKHGRVFRYYDREDAPSPSMFERVLLPVYFFGPGAFGSRWTTEISLRNNAPYVVEPYRPLPSAVICPLVPCSPKIPASSTISSLDLGASRSGGVLFFIPGEVAPNVHFGSLVRDTSHSAEGWGTEVRAVREREFRTGRMELLNIPISPKYRVALRVYNVDSVDEAVGITIFGMNGGQTRVMTTLALRSSDPCATNDPCASDEPAFAMIGDLVAAFPELAGEHSVRMQVFSSSRAWAFVSVTNNETQEVTIISPQ